MTAEVAIKRGPDHAPGRRAQPRWGARLRQSEAFRGYALMAPALLVLAVGIVVPAAILLAMSFWTRVGYGFDMAPTATNYLRIANEPIYGAFLTRSFRISGIVTIVTVLLCYPMAYYVAFHVHRRKMLWIVLMTLPFWMSYLLRVFAWKVILGYEGVVNASLLNFGLITAPLEFLLYSQTAVIITLAHAWAAFAILPMYVSLEKIDRSLLEAATVLGDGPVARFMRVTLPLSMPGVLAGFFLIFIPTTGDYITPALLGGPDGAMIGNLIQLQFGPVNNWPMGAALAVVLTLWIAAVALVFLFLSRKAQRRLS